jgi:hypothetical protein
LALVEVTSRIAEIDALWFYRNDGPLAFVAYKPWYPIYDGLW